MCNINILMTNKTPSKIGVTQRKTTSDIICENLNLQSQIIFQDYKCTLRSNISYFGRLYIGEEHIMFVSNMFGIVKKIALIIESISRLEQPEPNSIVVVGRRQDKIKEEEFLFTGFKDNHPFKIIHALWKKERLSADIMANSEEEKENESLDKARHSFDDAEIQISLFKAAVAEKELIKMLEIVFPCSVQQFFSFFLADNADVYSRQKHLQLRKARLIVVTPWKKSEQLNAQTREVTGTIKVKGVPLLSEARMSQVCMLTRNEKNEISLKIVTNMGDVPYNSYFNCEQHIVVTRQGDSKCRYVVHCAVIFNKHTYMKGTILTKTFADLEGEYKMWSENAKESLDKKRKDQESSSKAERQHIVKSLDVQFEPVKQAIEEKQPIKHKDENSLQYTDELKLVKQELAGVKASLHRLTMLVWLLLAVGVISLLLNILPSSSQTAASPL